MNQMNQQAMMQMMGLRGNLPKPGDDFPQPDDSETVIISGVALIKMLKHGRAGVPMEVMGLMVGEFIDEYTVKVVDVYTMPQSGTSVSVEAVDPVFQQRMLELLKEIGRPEMVVGWYHSHPGWGCWLSHVDQDMQDSFEKLHPRAVAVVVDPIRSVRGKVVIEAFRMIDKKLLLAQLDPRQSTSNCGQLNKPTVEQLVHNLNRQYYKMPIRYRMNPLEQQMLLNVHESNWTEGLKVKDAHVHRKRNMKLGTQMLKLAGEYNKMIVREGKYRKSKLEIFQVGRVNAKKHIRNSSEKLLEENIDQTLGTMLSNVIF